MTNAAFLIGHCDACRLPHINFLTDCIKQLSSWQWAHLQQLQQCVWADLLCLFALFRQNQPRIYGKDANQMEWLNLGKASESLRNPKDRINFGELCKNSIIKNQENGHLHSSLSHLQHLAPWSLPNSEIIPVIMQRKWRWQVSGQCPLSSHGVCQRLKGIPKRQLGWVRKFRSINWVTNECTKSSCMWNSFQRISVYFYEFISPLPVHQWKHFTSPNLTTSQPQGSCSWSTVPMPSRGNPWRNSPSGTRGKRLQRLKELHSNGCIFSSLRTTTNSVGRISGRWSLNLFSNSNWNGPWFMQILFNQGLVGA